MSGPSLTDLKDAYGSWVSPPTRTLRLHSSAAGKPGAPEGPSDMDVHAFEEDGAEPFVYLATAGMSTLAIPGPAPRIELVLVMAGRLDQAQFEALARRLGELATVPFQKQVFFAPNMVVGEFALPQFDGKNQLLLADFNIRTADHLPIEPAVRLLRVTPLFPAEATIARDIGDLETYERFKLESINHQDPHRNQAALAEPPGVAAPAITGDPIAKLWSDIEGWLGAHARPTLAALRPGADAPAIAELERTIGVALPQEYRESLARHDGRAYLTDYEYLSVAQVQKIWTAKKAAFDAGEFAGRDVADKGGGVIRNFWWHPGWIPVAEDGAGNLYCIDMVPAWQGKRGQLLRWERTSGPFPSSEKSFHDWLGTYRGDLLAGQRYEVDGEGFINIKP